MKIGVVSDTHNFDIPQQLIDDFKKVDLIVHAGDFCSVDELKIFKKLAKTVGVLGNMDNSELEKLLPLRTVFSAEDVQIGLCHGHGSSGGALENVKHEFKNDDVDIVIFGHSHHPFNKKIGKVLYFNPGSPNDIIRAPYCSYGLLDIQGKKIKAEIVKVRG